MIMSSPSSLPPIPVYRIDLGLPPEDRYVKLATDFSERMRAVVPLYEEILSLLLIYRPLILFAKFLTGLLLRRVADPVQTREIRSISKHAGIDLSLVIALNTVLDSLLGCTSGAIKVRSKHAVDSPSHLCHFRTLDWGMPALRDLLVSLEFVNSASADPEHVLARSITYAGFVGCLTGARPGLSLSLNHRPLLNAKTWPLIFHQLRILIGMDESISSRLRRVLLAPQLPIELSDAMSPIDTQLEVFSESFSRNPSSPCYLIFCTPREAVVIQKDFRGGRIKSSSEFIVQANHDTDHTKCCGATEFHHPKETLDSAQTLQLLGDEIWLGDSAERQDCIHRRWIAHGRKRAKELKGSLTVDVDHLIPNGVCIRSGVKGAPRNSQTVGGISKDSLLRWVSKPPILADCTHFVTIMDPLHGDILFLERGPDPELLGDEI